MRLRFQERTWTICRVLLIGGVLAWLLSCNYPKSTENTGAFHIDSNSMILSYRRVNNDSVTQTQLCASWNPPSKGELLNLLQQMSVVDVEKDYEQHSDYTCSVVGKIVVSGDTFEYNLNAGGYAYLYKIGQKEGVRLCAGSDTSLSKYFLSLELDSTLFR